MFALQTSSSCAIWECSLWPRYSQVPILLFASRFKAITDCFLPENSCYTSDYRRQHYDDDLCGWSIFVWLYEGLGLGNGATSSILHPQLPSHYGSHSNSLCLKCARVPDRNCCWRWWRYWRHRCGLNFTFGSAACDDHVKVRLTAMKGG